MEKKTEQLGRLESLGAAPWYYEPNHDMLKRPRNAIGRGEMSRTWVYRLAYQARCKSTDRGVACGN